MVPTRTLWCVLHRVVDVKSEDERAQQRRLTRACVVHQQTGKRFRQHASALCRCCRSPAAVVRDAGAYTRRSASPFAALERRLGRWSGGVSCHARVLGLVGVVGSTTWLQVRAGARIDIADADGQLPLDDATAETKAFVTKLVSATSQ